MEKRHCGSMQIAGALGVLEDGCRALEAWSWMDEWKPLTNFNIM